MDFFKAIQIQALRDVIKKPGDYNIRYVHRWYSKTFHTPLYLVEDLPVDEILRAYFEELYEEMDEGRIEDEKRKLTETDAERAIRVKKEEEDLYQDALFAEKVSKQEAERKDAKLQSQPKNQQQLSNFQSGPKLVESTIDAGAITDQEPVIQMKFLSETEFEKIITDYDAMQQPEKK